MNTDMQLVDTIKEVIDDARFAPSVHNSQPWLVTIVGDTLKIFIDPAFKLRDGDPTGRQTIISLGIFAEAISLAAEAKGLQTVAIDWANDHAIVRFTTASVSANAKYWINLLRTRSSDRSVYRPAVIDTQTLDRLTASRSSNSVTIHAVTDPAILQAIAQFTSQGIQLALSSVQFRQELSQYLVLPWSKKQRGIAVKSLYIPRLLAWSEPLLLRKGIGLDAEVKLEKKRWLSASAVLVITAKGDMASYWFETGRSYLRLSLAIEQSGLSQATSAAIVEASDFHEDIEKMIGTSERIQSLIRIGSGKRQRHYSPRIPTSEIITT